MRLVTILAATLLAFLTGAPAFAACSLGTPGQTVEVAIGGTGRSVQLHRPAGDASGRLPLVMLFHGSGGTATAMLRDSKLEATADAHGFVLVAANAGIPFDNGYAWNIPGVPTIAGTIPTAEDADDVAFVGDDNRLSRHEGLRRSEAGLRHRPLRRGADDLLARLRFGGPIRSDCAGRRSAGGQSLENRTFEARSGDMPTIAARCQ